MHMLYLPHIDEVQRQANIIFGDIDQGSSLGGILIGLKQDSVAEAVPHVDLRDFHGYTQT